MGKARGLIAAAAGHDDEHAAAVCGGPAWALPVANRPLLAHALATAHALAEGEPLLALPARGGTPLLVPAGSGVAGVLAAASRALAGAAVLFHHAEGLIVGDLAVPAPAGCDAVVIAPEDGDVDGAPAFVAGPEATRVAAGLPGDAPLPVLLDALAAAGGRIEVLTLPGAWRYDGRIESLLHANRLVLDALERRVSDADLTSARIEGRVDIHPTAVIERTTIRGPVVIGAGACIVDAFVGPYTAIGERARLDGAEVENSILLPGASIRHVGARIEASVLGADASIGRDFALPAAVRLRVGRGAEVTLA